MSQDPAANADLAEMYLSVRGRIIETVQAADASSLAAMVPACPAWSAQALLAHVVSLPSAIMAGDLPDGDPETWIQDLVGARGGASVGDLVAEWTSNDEGLTQLVKNAGLLLADLFVHESDLHNALGSPGHRDAPELSSQMVAAITAVGNDLAATDLAPVAVESPAGTWVTSDGEPGWTLQVSAWEAHRALNSRRTADELRAMPHTGNPEPYLEVLHNHLPLPDQSLNEN